MIPWTAEADARLTELWRQGLTAPDIARTLTAEGFPCDEIRLNGRVNYLRRSGVDLPARRRIPYGVPILGADGKRTNLGTLPLLPGYLGTIDWPDKKHCCWPLWGDNPDAQEPRLFCWEQVKAQEMPYCAAHSAVAYAGRTPSAKSLVD